jgi:tetratricopeptide (TPR) repeat protein
VSDIHVTREILRAVAHGDLHPHVLLDAGYRHLSALCPTCREEILAWSREHAGLAESKPLLPVLPTLLHRHSSALAAERTAARRDLQELLRLPHAERLARLRRARERFRSATLAALLLETSREKMPADFHAVHELAETALTVLQRVPGSAFYGELMVRAVTYMGNAERATGRLQQARSRFEFARSLVRFEGVTDSLALAELDWFEGALAMDQRRFRSAEHLLGRAIVLSLLAAGPPQAARPMLTLGTMYYNQGEYGKAVEVTQLAAGLLPGDQDELFYLSCRHNLAVYLCEAGAATRRRTSWSRIEISTPVSPSRSSSFGFSG